MHIEIRFWGSDETRQDDLNTKQLKLRPSTEVQQLEFESNFIAKQFSSFKRHGQQLQHIRARTYVNILQICTYVCACM